MARVLGCAPELVPGLQEPLDAGDVEDAAGHRRPALEAPQGLGRAGRAAGLDPGPPEHEAGPHELADVTAHPPGQVRVAEALALLGMLHVRVELDAAAAPGDLVA